MTSCPSETTRCAYSEWRTDSGRVLLLAKIDFVFFERLQSHCYGNIVLEMMKCGVSPQYNRGRVLGFGVGAAKITCCLPGQENCLLMSEIPPKGKRVEELASVPIRSRGMVRSGLRSLRLNIFSSRSRPPVRQVDIYGQNRERGLSIRTPLREAQQRILPEAGDNPQLLAKRLQGLASISSLFAGYRHWTRLRCLLQLSYLLITRRMGSRTVRCVDRLTAATGRPIMSGV